MANKLLLIEDNEAVRENTEEILELAGFDVSTAENGAIGVAKAKEVLPDIIICDIMMPKLDGYGVLHMLNKNPDTAKIPFIFLSAKADKNDIRKGMLMGADDYLTKPFEETELLEAIETRLKKSERIKSIVNSAGADIASLHGIEGSGLQELGNLGEISKEVAFKKKDTIYRQDSYPNCVFQIHSGRVKTLKVDEWGKELVTEIYKEGDYFGFMPLLEDTVFSDTAVAIEDCTISQIPKESFLELLSTSRDLANNFIKMLSNNIHEKEARLLKLAYGSVRERTAEALLEVNDKFGLGEGELMQINREDLASMVGTATESLIRTLSDFKEEKLIETEGRKIRLLSQDRLKKLAGRI